ncbi:MAG: NUDIX domain-containing protein [Alphaproteobacteria bacterium]|nr:NUDIX domain-containing protein [Alphaproteobacteria bacterium]
MHPLSHFKFCPKCGSERFAENLKNSKKCESCNFEFFKNPSIGCAAVVFDEQDRLLCIRRFKNPGAGLLGLPGGFVDLGETVEQAVKREVLEETGIIIKIDHLIANIPNSYIYKGIEQYPLDFYYSGKIVDMSGMRPQIGETAEILFIPRDKIDIDSFAMKSTKALLKQILER